MNGIGWGGTILERLTFLQEEAKEEGIDFNFLSQDDFLDFVQKKQVKRPFIVLSGENVRAVWRDTKGNQVGITFLGHSKIRRGFVRTCNTGIDVARRSYSESSIENIGREIRDFGLERLVFTEVLS